MNGRVTKNSKQLYYKGYLLHKKQGNIRSTAQQGDVLEGRGDGSFDDDGEYGKWEALIDEPQDKDDVKFFISWP